MAAPAKNAASTLPGRKKIFTLAPMRSCSMRARPELAKRLAPRNRNQARAVLFVIHPFNLFRPLASFRLPIRTKVFLAKVVTVPLSHGCADILAAIGHTRRVLTPACTTCEIFTCAPTAASPATVAAAPARGLSPPSSRARRYGDEAARAARCPRSRNRR